MQQPGPDSAISTCQRQRHSVGNYGGIMRGQKNEQLWCRKLNFDFVTASCRGCMILRDPRTFDGGVRVIVLEQVRNEWFNARNSRNVWISGLFAVQLAVCYEHKSLYIGSFRLSKLAWFGMTLWNRIRLTNYVECMVMECDITAIHGSLGAEMEILSLPSVLLPFRRWTHLAPWRLSVTFAMLKSRARKRNDVAVVGEFCESSLC